MIRALILFGLLLMAPLAALAQGAAAPRVTAELSSETTVVGQPVVLRIEVLVPTWLPSPPAFPNLDAPNLIVRLPERASGPISETIDGETWSGVSRAYRLYPMVPGTVSLPAQEVTVIYADPETTDPVRATVPLPPVSIAATVPEGAEGLDPLILATGLALEQQVEGPEGALGQGDAVTRTVTATITGTSPLFIPPLIPDLATPAVQGYPRDPVVEETQGRDGLSGSRREAVTYVARHGGTLELPTITLEWFNLDTGAVETAEAPGQSYEVDAPPPAAEVRLNWRRMALLAVGALALTALAALMLRRLAPPIRAWRARRRDAWQASERFAARAVRRAIAARDLDATHRALALWDARCPGMTSPALNAALAAVGAARFGPGPAGGADWQALNAAFAAERHHRLAAEPATGALPPLNPTR